MSAAEEGEMNNSMTLCASCGIAGVDDVKLQYCDGCDLVKYCSDECQRDHRPKHEEECVKRAAELRDEILFKQHESSFLGDCPICCVPIPIDTNTRECFSLSCCSKRICRGCVIFNQIREEEARIDQKCPFCRQALLETGDEVKKLKRLMKRIEANDAVAMFRMGYIRYNEGDYEAAFEYLTRAAVLGNVEAHFQLSIFYIRGVGVEKDEVREVHHAEQAAIGGHPDARYNLGCVEHDNGRYDKAARHWIIASKLGHDDSLEEVKNLYKAGFVSKEDFAAALRCHKAAIDATKTPQREEAAAILAERDRRSI